MWDKIRLWLLGKRIDAKHAEQSQLESYLSKHGGEGWDFVGNWYRIEGSAHRLRKRYSRLWDKINSNTKK